MKSDDMQVPASADESRAVARADLRRSIVVRGIANALCVPVAFVMLRLVHNATVARDGAVVLCMVVALVIAEIVLRRRVRVPVRPGNVVMAFSVFFGLLFYGMTLDIGPVHPWVYPVGVVAILAVWGAAALVAKPVTIPEAGWRTGPGSPDAGRG